MITYQGRTQCVPAWARELGMSPRTIYSRLAKGWGVEEAFETKAQPYSNRLIGLTCQGETHTLAEWARLHGIKLSTLHRRLYRSNWPLERALSVPVQKSVSPKPIRLWES